MQLRLCFSGLFPNVTLELLRRGYTADQIQLILGEDLLRVLAAAELAKVGDPEEGVR